MSQVTITDKDREAAHALRRHECSHGYRSWASCNDCIAAFIAQAREEGRRGERERVSRLFVERTPGGWPDDDADVPDGWASWILLLHDAEAGDVLGDKEAAAHFLRNMQPAIRARGEV